MRAALGVLSRDGDLFAIPAMPSWNAMTPPKLARDAPVSDVIHPFVVGFCPICWHKLNAPVFHGTNRRRGERLHAHPPLLGNQRLDNCLAAVAFAGAQRVRLDFFYQA